MLEALTLASDATGGLDGREVAAQVMLGVAQACGELGRSYQIEKIQYVASDSPPVTVYRHLAIHLIRRIAGR